MSLSNAVSFLSVSLYSGVQRVPLQNLLRLQNLLKPVVLLT